MGDRALIDKEYVPEKFQGKGGWTYAQVPEILQNKHSSFGWVRVRGSIDNFEIKGYHLMPMVKGKMFLPVKAEIRKMIKKQAGDTVRVILYEDNLPTEIPEELLVCLKDEPHLHDAFATYSEGQKRSIIEWIYSAKTDEAKIERIAQTLNRIEKEQK